MALQIWFLWLQKLSIKYIPNTKLTKVYMHLNEYICYVNTSLLTFIGG